MEHFKGNLIIKLMIFLILSLMTSTSVIAESLFLRKGESKTLKLNNAVDTIFISNPKVADYQILNTNTVILFAKDNGSTDLTVYGKKGAILLKANIEVDPVIGQINQSIKQQFPGNDVTVRRFLSNDDEKTSYIISGLVQDEETMDKIYIWVGQAIGGELEQLKLEWHTSASSSIENTFNRKHFFKNLINNMQLMNTNQVNVELTVVEINKEFKDALGIDWGQIGSGAVGVFNLFKFKGLDASEIRNTINAIKNDTIARVMAQPNLTVLSGESASFLVGGEIPLAVTNDRGQTTITYKPFGINLAIAPKVERKNKIKLFISNEISDLDGSLINSSGHWPKLRTRRSRSTIELADGDSFIIGGLLQEKDKETLSRLPFIGDVPILGAIARNTTTEREKYELIVIAKVKLVKSINSLKDIQLPQFRRTHPLQLFFNINSHGVSENRLSGNTADIINKGGFAK